MDVRREDCESAVRNLLGSGDFVLEGYEVKRAGEATVGFMGRHCRLTASVRVVGGDDVVRQIRLFAKLPPASKSHRTFVIGSKLFHREYVAYTELVPLLTASLPPGVRLPFPRCVFGRDTDNPKVVPAPGSAEEEVIILEDVSFRGYEFLERFPLLDLPHCLVVMKSLARIHAASMLLQYRSHRTDEEPPGPLSLLEDDLWKQDMNARWVSTCSRSMASAAARIWPERFGGGEEAILESLEKAWSTIYEAGTAFPQYANVICHGDSWTNNILFSYHEGSRIPSDCVFVDLQIVQYAPPVTDVLFFLHACTSREFRDRHARTLLEFYHTELEKCLGSDLLEAVLPFQSLLLSFEDLKVVGLVIPTAYLPVILEENDEVLTKSSCEPLDIDEAILRDRGERIASNCIVSEAYRDRVTECFRECLEGLGLWR